jgi:hypothetical protein
MISQKVVTPVKPGLPGIFRLFRKLSFLAHLQIAYCPVEIGSSGEMKKGVEEKGASA